MISFVESEKSATFAVMKKRTILKRWILMLKCISIIIAVSACSSDDDLKNRESQDCYDLYKTWVLVSYGDNTVEIMKESEGYLYQICFHPDGTYSGYAYGNEMLGEYKSNGNNITISRPCMTKVNYDDADPDEFFMNNIQKVYTFNVTETELRLYYSGHSSFKFRVKQ